MMSYSSEELDEYREIFALFDRQKTGEVNLNELGFIVRSLGFHPSESRIRQFQEEYGDTSIDFQQFLQILNCLTNEIDDEIDIIEAFRVFDKEGQGTHLVFSLGKKTTKCNGSYRRIFLPSR